MDDNTFECPKCGAKIYPEMTRCPECGQNMYPEDEEAIPAAAENSQAVWMGGFGAVVIGWMIAGGIALLLHFIVASFVAPARLGAFGKAVLLLAGPVGAVVGGYISLGISRHNPISLGAVVGGLTLPILALYATHWVEVTPSLLLNPWILATGALTVLAGVMGGWLHYKFSQDTDWKENGRCVAGRTCCTRTYCPRYASTVLRLTG